MQCVESRCPCNRHSTAQSILGRLGHAAGRGCRDKMAGLRKEIAAVRLHRGAHRKRRRSNNTPVVALVGYTNAGKSTLLNRLTAAGVLQEDALFATLDPTTRRLMLPSGKRALLTDTVGFIQKLPTQLIAAFRATLEEVEARADPCSVAPAANSRLPWAPTDPICRAVLCMLRGRKRIGCGVGGAEAVSSLSAAMLVVVCIAHIW